MSYGLAFQPVCPVCNTPDLKCCKEKCKDQAMAPAKVCWYQCCGCAPLHRAVCQGSAYFPVKVAYGKRVLVCTGATAVQPTYACRCPPGNCQCGHGQSGYGYGGHDGMSAGYSSGYGY